MLKKKRFNVYIIQNIRKNYREWQGDLEKPHFLWDAILPVDWCFLFEKCFAAFYG